MRAIEEYKLTGTTTGTVTLYPENNKNINYKKIVTEPLESYKNQKKKENTVWENYNNFIQESIKKYNLNINLNPLKQQLAKLEEMKKGNKYTIEDINNKIDEINKIYKEIIEKIKTSN